MTTPSTALTPTWRAGIVALSALLPLGVLMMLPPITQDPAYHAFADQRTLFDIANFANVVSNVPFLLAGIAGVVLCVQHRLAGAMLCWCGFFVGLIMITFGSGYYHFAPDNEALVWDRLPMTVAFTSLFCALIAERIRTAVGRALLAPAILTGIASVVWWRATDDLRFYAWIQFGPLIALPFVMWLFPRQLTHGQHLLAALVLYAIGKFAEAGDHAIMANTAGWISGHSLKHLFAAAACFVVYDMLRRRGPAPTI